MTEEEIEGLNELEIEELKVKEADERLNKAYYSCFHSPEGQIVLKDLLNSYYRSTCLPDSFDPNVLLVNEGSRYVVIKILARMEAIGGKNED